jgi:hypothetical protein
MRINLRGRYEGGGMVVTAKHWWHPRERKSARLGAMLLEHHRADVSDRIRRRTVNALVYGVDMRHADGGPIDPRDVEPF